MMGPRDRLELCDRPALGSKRLPPPARRPPDEILLCATQATGQ